MNRASRSRLKPMARWRRRKASTGSASARKRGAPFVLTSGDELKLVFPQDGMMPEAIGDLAFKHFWLQPRDGPQIAAHTQAAIAYCLAHPRWRLSLQTHKLIGIP